MARTQLEKELSRKRVNRLILVIDLLLVIYIVAVLLSYASPEFKAYIESLFR